VFSSWKISFDTSLPQSNYLNVGRTAGATGSITRRCIDFGTEGALKFERRKLALGWGGVFKSWHAKIEMTPKDFQKRSYGAVEPAKALAKRRPH
jgi:hypothetical protein